MYIAISDATLFNNLIVNDLNCQLKLYSLATETIFFSKDPKYQVDMLTLLEKTNKLVTVICWNISLYLNLFLCIDLCLILRDPFGSKEKRERRYLIAACLIAGLTLLANLGSGNNYVINCIEAAGFFVFTASAIFTTVYAGYHLLKPGVSKAVRKLIFARHIFYIWFYFLSNLYIAASVFFNTFSPN